MWGVLHYSALNDGIGNRIPQIRSIQFSRLKQMRGGTVIYKTQDSRHLDQLVSGKEIRKMDRLIRIRERRDGSQVSGIPTLKPLQ